VASFEEVFNEFYEKYFVPPRDPEKRKLWRSGTSEGFESIIHDNFPFEYAMEGLFKFQHPAVLDSWLEMANPLDRFPSWVRDLAVCTPRRVRGKLPPLLQDWLFFKKEALSGSPEFSTPSPRRRRKLLAWLSTQDDRLRQECATQCPKGCNLEAIVADHLKAYELNLPRRPGEGEGGSGVQ